MTEPYFRFARKLLESDLWLSEKFTRGQAWIDLIGLANHAIGYIRIRGVKLEVCRGYIGWSEERLAIRWKWSRGKVRRFLKELEISEKIEQQKNNVTTLIKIINYEYYQGGDTTNNTTNGQQTDTKQYNKRTANGTLTIKNEKNEKNEKENTLSKNAITNGFEKFWDAYPIKKGKGQALITWDKLKKLGRLPDVDVMTAAIEAQKKERAMMSNEGRFCPEWKHPSTWLNAMGWEDDTSGVDRDEKYREAVRVLRSDGSECFYRHCESNGLDAGEVNAWISRS